MESNHISVCICTFNRPELLKCTLNRLVTQKTGRLFNFSLVIVDNDYRQSAKSVVSAFASKKSVDIIYCVEPVQNIALARNRALKSSKGNFIAFIDDDEIPNKDWLYNLFKTCKADNIDGVLGPVRPRFEHVPPKWIIKGKFFNRPSYNTGHNLSWPETRSGNVLFKKEIISGMDNPFREEFGTGGEDVDFFRRMIVKGKSFLWCKDAVVSEFIPPERCKRIYQIKKALLRGANSLKVIERNFILNILKSYVAMLIYTTALPFLLIAGHHIFMKYLISDCDHIGKILKLFDINPVKKRGV